MTQTHVGWGLIVVGVGMVMTSLGTEIQALTAWGDAVTPSFVGKAIFHVGGVILAAMGGKFLEQPK